jgi:hypothetical protein
MAAEPFGRFPVARTADVDEAQEAMRSTFLPLDLRPLEPVGSGGGLDLGLNATLVGDVTVTYVRFRRGVQIHTAEAENYHVNLPITGGTVSRSGRREPVASTPQLAAVFMPELDAELQWQAGTAQFCLMFPRHVLQQELEAMLDRPLAAPLAFAPAMDVTGDAGRAWVDVLRLIERQSRYSRSLLDHPLAAGNLQRILVDGLLLAQPHTYTDALAAPDPPAAPPAIHRAIELLHTHPEQPWTTAGLARAVAVSARSLQDGFAVRWASHRRGTCARSACSGSTRTCRRPTRTPPRSPPSPAAGGSCTRAGWPRPTARSSGRARRRPCTTRRLLAGRRFCSAPRVCSAHRGPRCRSARIAPDSAGCA